MNIRHGVSLAIGLVFLGWVLAVYRFPLWGWGVTWACLIHLSCRGKSAVPLSLLWVNGVMCMAAVKYAMPIGFIWRNAKYWSISLIFLWVLATAVVFSVARAPQLQSSMPSAALFRLWPVLLITVGLGCGRLLHSQGLMPQ
ncbi:MAG: hypothetical protein AAGB01_01180 [Cyanobacteria bacterium P01_F01_bin.42]